MAYRDALRVLALKHMNRSIGDDVVDWAALELDSGNASDAVVAISCFDKPAHWEDIAELFHRALTELGYATPQFEDCLRQYARSVAEDIVDGRLATVDGCSEITTVCELLDCPHELFSFAWLELVNGYHPDSAERIGPNEVETQIRQYSELLMQT